MLVDIPQEDYEFLKGLQHELLNQTDDGQADPIFWVVMERIEFAVPEDCGEPQIYLGDGYYDTIESVVALINEQIEDEYKEEWEAVDKMDYNEVAEFHRERMGNEETRVVYIKEMDVLSQNTGAFLTKRACREYIDKYGYNHSKPRTFAMTAYRNFEYDHLLKIIKSLGESPWISIEERLPDDKQLVIVAYSDSMMLCRFFKHAVVEGEECEDVFCMSDGLLDFMSRKIAGFTHWMPRPESPKENDDRL